jgi:hypothetical protein
MYGDETRKFAYFIFDFLLEDVIGNRLHKECQVVDIDSEVGS